MFHFRLRPANRSRTLLTVVGLGAVLLYEIRSEDVVMAAGRAGLRLAAQHVVILFKVVLYLCFII